jgi:hypothetical protein
MENCNTILSIHEGMGTTQNERVKPALQPDFFLLDERNEQDFILFVQKLSPYVKFYNEFDIEEGDWSNFFQKESTSILILIANWKIELLQNSFEITKNEILLNTDFSSQQSALVKYFTQIEKEYTKLAEKIDYLDDAIIEKQNLFSARELLKGKFTSIIDQIDYSKDITMLLQNYVFVKTVQQLFGLLLSWKNYSKTAIDYQLNSYPKHAPQYALFLSFLKLLHIAKEKLNEYTKKHLDFYYKDVLHIENQQAKPDYVHLVVEPFQTTAFLLPKDTIFLAGKNTAGQKKYYASTTDQTVNGIKLNSFLSTHYNQDNYFKADLLDFNAKNKGFNAFTSAKQECKEGIMIASPILYLQSGERTIKLRFNETNYKAKDFDFYITGEEKTIEITLKENTNPDQTTGAEYIKLTIPATEKKIIPFDTKIHSDLLVATAFPVLKIVPKNSHVISAISSININVSVNKFKSFVLESDFGTIDTEKAFYPFGEFPKKGNGIILSSNEFFMKHNAKVSLSMGISNKLTVFQLNKGSWNKFSDTLQPITNSYPLQEYNFDAITTQEIDSNGKIRIELDDTKYEGEKYMEDYIAAITQTTKGTTTGTTITNTTTNATRLPHKPRIKEFVFNYTITENIKLGSREDENNPIELYQIVPFGYVKLQNKIFHFSKNKPLEGTIYLGFEKVAPRDGLNFLIQLEEGTANPLLEPAKISWAYLNNNIWEKLEQNAIGDETYTLTQSGLVTITIPEFEDLSNTRLATGLFWLKIGVSNIEAICNFIGVHTQALKAVLTDYENVGTAFMENTPKETISKLYKPFNKVKKIIQPYDSFNGRIAEPDAFLYTRASERLRHKNRAITSWDYEKIILQEFPEVFRVKALNHYRYDTSISNVSAGYVTLIPVAKNSNAKNISWKPLLSLNKMLLIKEYLAKVTSPHVRINVKAPKLEKVAISCKVKFHLQEGMDSRLYITELINTINTYLSPWVYETSAINFANEIEFSSIIQLIDNQSYVDYITDFKVAQFLLDSNNEIVGGPIQNLNKIRPQTDFTLFIPNESHLITEL